MEEVKKVHITTEGLANANSQLNKQVEEIRKDLAIPKVELPAETPRTAEQLKQFYDSEQWKPVIEGFNRAWEAIKEAITPVIEAIAETVKNMHKTIIEAYKVDPEIKKCYGIYKRTKNRRIRKKQMTRIYKIIERRYIKNGNMDKDAG